MSKVVRYGTGAAGHSKTALRYCRRSSTHVIVDSSSEDSKCDSTDPFAPIVDIPQLQGYTPAVTCIAVSQSNATAESSVPSLVLVGRCDGSLDLFSLDSCDPLQSWSDLTCYADSKEALSRGGGRGGLNVGPSENTAIVSVQWVPWKAAGSFVVVDAAGRIYYFDLLKNSDRPLHVETANASTLLPQSFALSSCRSIGGSVYMAVGDVDMPVSSGRLSIRKLHEDLMWQETSSGESKGDEQKSSIADTIQNASWVGRTVAQSVLTEYHVGGIKKTRK